MWGNFIKFSSKNHHKYNEKYISLFQLKQQNLGENKRMNENNWFIDLHKAENVQISKSFSQRRSIQGKNNVEMKKLKKSRKILRNSIFGKNVKMDIKRYSNLNSQKPVTFKLNSKNIQQNIHRSHNRRNGNGIQHKSFDIRNTDRQFMYKNK